MLASAGKARDAPSGENWVFEPKYDGIRIIALATPQGVALITRNGIDKCRQFPEITRSIRELAGALKRNLVLDGEVVALNADGQPARFQELQGRMHLLDENTVQHRVSTVPTALVLFDILVDGSELLVERPWHERRARLERTVRTLPRSAAQVIRVSEVARGDATALMEEAREHAWEGIMAKRRDCPYEPGRRVRHWQKLKLENRQEFVIAGWTEPRNSRKHFGAILLGYYDADGQLVYAGHTGGGFSERSLDDVYRRLKSIERSTSPFPVTPKTNERPHWAEPRYVAEVRFNEWTHSGALRQPIFLGLRDDKNARQITREPPSGLASEARRPPPLRSAAAEAKRRARKAPKAASTKTVVGKIFFPVPKVTKGRLMAYYAEISPYLLPALEDRPLVLKRWPNGIQEGGEFYQQKAPDKVPPGVRVEEVADEGITTQRRLIGGNLATLLYTIQLGAISTDPWHSRVQHIADADYSIVDLDPGPKATFKRVVQIARWVKEELDEYGLHAVLKTSGASGIHVVLPLPRGASYEISVALAELVARRVNEKHPKETTIKRAVKSRPPDSVYVDYLQNIRGKTVASVYSARAETYASVSAPLKWSELTNDLDPRDFTIDNMVQRVKRVGDLWGVGMRRVNRLPGIIGDAAA